MSDFSNSKISNHLMSGGAEFEISSVSYDEYDEYGKLIVMSTDNNCSYAFTINSKKLFNIKDERLGSEIQRHTPLYHYMKMQLNSFITREEIKIAVLQEVHREIQPI